MEEMQASSQDLFLSSGLSEKGEGALSEKKGKRDHLSHLE